jgi:hypothetical protein
LKSLRSGPYSFQKLTQYSQGHILLGTHALNINSFITRDTLFLPFPRMGPFGTKMMYLATENPERYEVFLLKVNSVLTTEKHA